MKIILFEHFTQLKKTTCYGVEKLRSAVATLIGKVHTNITKTIK